jgi:hypothetical protein
MESLDGTSSSPDNEVWTTNSEIDDTRCSLRADA